MLPLCYVSSEKDSYGISLHDRGAMDYLLRPGSTWRCCGPRPTPASRRRACWRWRRWPPRGRRTQPGCFLKSEARDSNQEPAAFAKVEQYDWLTHLRPITRALAKRGSIGPKTIIQKRVFTLKSVEARVRVSFYTNYQWGDSMTHRRPDVSTEKKLFLQKFWTKKSFDDTPRKSFGVFFSNFFLETEIWKLRTYIGSRNQHIRWII